MPMTIGTINNAETRERLTGPAVKGFFNLAHAWDLSEAQQMALLGQSISRSTLHAWEATGPKASLSSDQLMRISFLLGIYEGLERFFRRAPAEATRWLHRPRTTSPFDGETPLQVMVNGGIPALDAVRRFVDDAAGGPPSRAWYVAPSREG